MSLDESEIDIAGGSVDASDLDSFCLALSVRMVFGVKLSTTEGEGDLILAFGE